MKLYFAGCDGMDHYNLIKEKKEYYKLFNFYNFDKRHLKNIRNENNTFLDSGAFSAMNSGKIINIDDYINFIKENSSYWNIYAGLDVIGDYKKSRLNQEYMESKGLNPLPTFHYGSPYEELQRLCEKYNYIALGGLVPIALNKNKIRNHLDKCFSIILKHDKIKIHGFGVNAFSLLERYPFYSVDATSWLSSSRYGRDSFEKNERQRIFNNHTVHYKERTTRIAEKYFKKAEQITRLWEKRGIKWD